MDIKTRLGEEKSLRFFKIRGAASIAEDLQESQFGERRKNINLCCVLTKEFDSTNAIRVQDVVDVVGEIVADDFWAQVDAGRPLLDQIFNVQQAVIA
jgi:hypothetical protein